MMPKHRKKRFPSQAARIGGRELPYPRDMKNPWTNQYMKEMMMPMVMARGRLSLEKGLMPVAAPVRAMMKQIKGNAIFPYRSTT